ncbi:MAG: cytochrome c [Cytophagales bacterium]|nr:cytochrome c [Cytophagales bacterium]
MTGKAGPIIFAFIVFFSCSTDERSGRFDHLDKRTKIRLRQYLAEGKRLYTLHCANCHQPDGRGLARLYPPLKGSDYLLPNVADVICGMRYGQKGEITVNGIVFNQEMPGIPGITDLEIAEIATYVYTVFADTARIFTLNEIRQIMNTCQTHADTTDNL